MTAEHNTQACGVLASLIRSAGEWLFALFLFAGYYKADPRLSFIQTRIDITLLFLILSFLVFFHRALRKMFAQRIPRSFTRVATFFLLLKICLLAGLLYTQSTQYGFDKTLRFIFLTGWAFWGSVLLIPNVLSLRRFCWALVAISTAMAIDALLSYPGVGRVSFVTAFGSNYIALARANGLGLLTTMILLLPTARRRWVKLCLWGLATLQLWATLSAGARGPVFALILSFLLFFVLSVRGFPCLKIDRFALRLGTMAVLVAGILILVGEALFSTLAYRIQIFATERGISAATRITLYREAIELWANSPIWGTGTGQFGIAVTGEDIRLYPHNILLELGAETGIIGVLVFLSMIGFAFAKGVDCLHRGKGATKTVTRYLLVAAFFALLNAMISGDINDNRVLFTLVGLLAATPHFQGNVVARGVSSCATPPSNITKLSNTKEL